MQRYTWEDGLIEAQAVKAISNGGLMTALKLARVFNWSQGGELRWANELAADVVGLGRSTYYTNVKELKAAGYLKTVNGNLVAILPDNQEEVNSEFEAQMEAKNKTYKAAQAERKDSRSGNYNPGPRKNDLHVQNPELLVQKTGPASPENGTCESKLQQGYSDNTYSDNTYSEDSSTDNSSSDAASQRQPAPLRGLAYFKEKMIDTSNDFSSTPTLLDAFSDEPASPENGTSSIDHSVQHDSNDDCWDNDCYLKGLVNETEVVW